MIYSVHDPVNGGFRYFEGGADVAINDDLPTPRYDASVRTPIGIPASLAARPLPPDARPTGSGALPVGSMSTGQPGLWKGTSKGTVPSGLGAVSLTPSGLLPIAFLVGAGASVSWGATRHEKGWPFLAAGAALLLGAVWASGRSA